MIGNRLMDSIIKEQIKDVSIDFTEVFIDAAMEDGILKEIPVVSTFYRIYKAGSKIKESYFLKKLLLFLNSTSTIDIKERKEFWEKLNKNPQEKVELGDKLIQLLDRIDEMKKAVWAALAFKELILSNLDKNDFYDLIYSIDNIKAHLAVNYYEYNIGYFDQRVDYLNHFASIGLLYNESAYRTSYSTRSKVNMKKPRIADLFCKFVWQTDQNEIVGRHKGRIDKKLVKKGMPDKRITQNPETIKKTLNEFILELNQLSNEEILNVKPTDAYFILDEKTGVVIDENSAYYFDYQGWYNSGVRS